MKQFFTIIGLATVFATTAPAAIITPNITMGYDDGFAENSIGVGATDYTIWLNAFKASARIDVLGAQIAFGPNPGDGAPVSVYLWSDPTNDGDPTDAVLLETVTTVTSSANFGGSAVPLTFADFSFSPVTFDTGHYFYVGFQSTGWALIDTDNTPQESWLFSDFTSSLSDPNSLGTAAGGGPLDSISAVPGVFPIRTLAFIPEPSTYLGAATAIGLIGFIAWRRRKASKSEE